MRLILSSLHVTHAIKRNTRCQPKLAQGVLSKYLGALYRKAPLRERQLVLIQADGKTLLLLYSLLSHNNDF
jgi:hypothetical protein